MKKIGKNAKKNAEKNLKKLKKTYIILLQENQAHTTTFLHTHSQTSRSEGDGKFTHKNHHFSHYFPSTTLFWVQIVPFYIFALYNCDGEEEGVGGVGAYGCVLGGEGEGGVEGVDEEGGGGGEEEEEREGQ